MALEELEFLEQQIGQIDQEMANLLRPHEDAVQRLAQVPGLGVDSAAADDRGSGSHGSDLSFGQATLLVGWCMPRRR